MKTFVSLLSLEQHNYYITSNTVCQVLFQKNFNLFFGFFRFIVRSDFLDYCAYFVTPLAGLG